MQVLCVEGEGGFCPHGECNLLLREHVNKCWFQTDKGKCIQDKYGNLFCECINQTMLSIVRSSFFCALEHRCRYLRKKQTNNNVAPKDELIILDLLTQTFA